MCDMVERYFRGEQVAGNDDFEHDVMLRTPMRLIQRAKFRINRGTIDWQNHGGGGRAASSAQTMNRRLSWFHDADAGRKWNSSVAVVSKPAAGLSAFGDWRGCLEIGGISGEQASTKNVLPALDASNIC